MTPIVIEDTLVTIGDKNYWTGHREIVIDGVTYVPSDGLILVSQIAAAAEQLDHRLQINFPLATPENRSEIKKDPGPVDVVVQKISSLDLGKTFKKVGLPFYGLLSDTNVENDIAQKTVETPLGDITHGKPGYWSHGDQQDRDPSDLGLEFVSTLSQGRLETKFPK